MIYKAWFQCSTGCDGTYPLNTIIYRCPDCNGLLEVKHDIAPLRHRSAAAWIELFERRYMSTQYPYGSGVWGKKELVCPNIDDKNVVSMYEGGTNLFWADRFGNEIGLSDLWIKQCGNSHTGSFKDLGMTVLVSMVRQMRTEGKDIRAVLCASTGDTSASLAAYAAAAGIPAIILLPKAKVSAAQLIQPIANGAVTFALDTDFDGCMAIVQKLSTRAELYLANSMNSLRIEGQKTISIEIV
ncbi:pyridoxal-phosphate dependent enzyme, partial [Candidatus Poribacteria bacterium]|nr:pyridoxal-phosphate dependent enzyme [Candidatus Poribacteria bacterium]